MKESVFDGLTREFSESVTRRNALRGGLGTLLAAMSIVSQVQASESKGRSNKNRGNSRRNDSARGHQPRDLSAEDCRMEGDSCSGSQGCCLGFVCDDGVCAAPIETGGEGRPRALSLDDESAADDEITNDIRRIELKASKGLNPSGKSTGRRDGKGNRRGSDKRRGGRGRGKGGNGQVGAEDAGHVNIQTMRTPWSSAPGYAYPTWRVSNGYGSGRCHQFQSVCGGDEYYAFDLVPINGNAGGRNIFSPLAGRVIYARDHGSIGWLVKIAEKDVFGRLTGNTVHLYHLMGVTVRAPQEIPAGHYLGQVYNQYAGVTTNNHLHIQVNNSANRSQPLKLAGRSYRSGSTWFDTRVRDNTLYSGPNFSGDRHSIYVANDSNLGTDNVLNDNASSMRVNSGCVMTLFEHTSYAGAAIQLGGGEYRDLSTISFNNRTSSVQLRCT